jgi:Uma2 family endonuclease
MPHLKKAELIEGVVYMPSPVSRNHGMPHGCLVTWLGTYAALTPGTEMLDNTTVRLKLGANQPQPDAFVRILSSHGGRSDVDDEGFISGAPEFTAEVSWTSKSYDLNEKLKAYERNGVQEYLVWRVEDEAIDWFALRGGKYQALRRTTNGLLKSRVFPGLWLDVPALLEGNLARVLEVAQEGIASAQHARFVAKLERRAKG